MIVFIYVPDFYASVEQAESGLAGEPVIVGGDPAKGAAVLSVSSEARTLGLEAGMSVEDALRRCPGVTRRPTRMRVYREAAAQVRALLREQVERFEPVGMEGAYLECPPSVDALGFAAGACVRLRAELGLPARAGIGPTRFVAHLAARHAPEGGLRRVYAREAIEFLGSFPVTELWGLGPATAEKLTQSGIVQIVDLQKRDVSDLATIVGRRNAQAFLELATGRDVSRLRPAPRAKSLSREQTLDEPTGDLRALGEQVGQLAGDLAHLLVREGLAARTVCLGLTYEDGQRCSRAHTVPRALTAQRELADLGLELLTRTQAGLRGVRRLSLKASRLSRRDTGRDARQLQLF